MKAFFLLFVVVLANVISLEPNTSFKPSIVYLGEIITSFDIIYSEEESIPLDVSFTINDKPMTCHGVDLTYVCQDVKIETENSIIKDSTPRELGTLKAKTGQKILSITPAVIPNDIFTDITVTYALEYDANPTLHAENGLIPPVNCKLLSGNKSANCSLRLAAGEYSLKSNGLVQDPVIKIKVKAPLDPISFTPQKYYIGEEVTYTINFPDAFDVPSNLDLKTSKDKVFSKCSANGAVVSCPNVKIDTEETNLNINNSATSPRKIITISTLKDQSLVSIDKTKIIQKEKSIVVLTFAKEYDLLPIIKLKGKETLAVTCSFAAEKTIVNCPLTVNAVDTYEVVYNGKDSGKKIEVAIGATVLKISLMIMLMGLLF